MVTAGPGVPGPYLADSVVARHASPVVHIGFEIAGTPHQSRSAVLVQPAGIRTQPDWGAAVSAYDRAERGGSTAAPGGGAGGTVGEGGEAYTQAAEAKGDGMIACSPAC